MGRERGEETRKKKKNGEREEERGGGGGKGKREGRRRGGGGRGGGGRERIQWTARERAGRTGEDRGIPRWHLISLSFLLSFSLFPSFFCPNKSSWLLLNQLIPSRRRENCNNLSLIWYLSLSLTPSSCLFACLACSSVSHRHTSDAQLVAAEATRGANYWTFYLVSAGQSYRNIHHTCATRAVLWLNCFGSEM